VWLAGFDEFSFHEQFQTKNSVGGRMLGTKA